VDVSFWLTNCCAWRDVAVAEPDRPISVTIRAVTLAAQ
jgi:hypothetical protein